MTEKTTLDYALDLMWTTLYCPCGRSWKILSKRVRPHLQTICPKCRTVDQIDEATAVRINRELNDAMRQVADQLRVPHEPISMPKFRKARKLKEPEPRGYPVGLVGESFYQPAIRKCFPSDQVKLTREPNNPHDPLAIAVVTADGSKIGYIPRGNFIHRLVHDECGGCSARILKLPTSNDADANIGVVLDVVIDDTLVGTLTTS